MIVAGVLCDYGFAGGWPSAFYVSGMVGCVWSFSWFFLCYNSPPTHPRISTTELEYWERTIGNDDLVSRLPTPWRKILTSVRVWALAVAFFVNDWGYFTLVTCLPLYTHDVLGFNMTSSGLFSAFPFMASIITIPLFGMLADWLRSPGRLSTTFVRKTFCVSGFISTAFLLVVTGYLGCDRILVMTTLFAAIACKDMGFTGIAANAQDLASLHAGMITGVINTVGMMSAIIAPMAVGMLTYEKSTREEWQKVFFISAGLYTIGAIVFLIFGSGERQCWAD